MVARIKTVAFQGIDVQGVDVEVQIASGLPAFTIVGLPDKAVGESRERVRAALHALGLALPAKRITINLAPADVFKEGSHYDLPIALGLLAVMGVVPIDAVMNYVVLGELSLDGSIRAVTGVLPAAVHAQVSNKGLICPSDRGGEAAWAGDLDILAPNHLLQLLNHFKGTQVLHRPEPKLGDAGAHAQGMRIADLADVKGQETAKRALEIAAAGGHNMLMLGPPGSGKSMLASCLPGILPPLSPREALEVSIIHSIAGTLPEGGLVQTRPFRAPHHSASQAALVGGGQRVKPGEISLSHCGVLFLDELPEFQRASLEALRQPLESGQTLIARANYHVAFPARFQLMAAMNPCPCGYLGDADQHCSKAPRCGEDYQGKLSGPLLDRIDIHVDVPAVSIRDLALTERAETSETVAVRVQRARDVQRSRLRSLGSDLNLNAEIQGQLLEQATEMDADAKTLLLQAADKMKLSARAYHRILRVARTIADLQPKVPEMIGTRHIAEALSYRRLSLKEEPVMAKTASF